jgi:hypothetical protein
MAWWALVTDFEEIRNWRMATDDAVRWLNGDNQFAVESPERGGLCIYDILVGKELVARWPIGQGRRPSCLDVWRANMPVWFEDGRVALSDARTGVETVSLPLEGQAIICME